jgi:hypothetical protein
MRGVTLPILVNIRSRAYTDTLLPRYQPRQNRHGIGGADQTARFPLDHDIDIDIVILCL